MGACPLRVACSSDAWKLNQFFCRRWGAVPPAFPLYGTLFTLCPSPVYFGLHHHRATMSGARAPPLSPSKATSSRRSTQWSRKTRWASSASSPPPTTCRQRTMTSPSRAPTEHAPLPPPPPPAVRLPSILSGLLFFCCYSHVFWSPVVSSSCATGWRGRLDCVCRAIGTRTWCVCVSVFYSLDACGPAAKRVLFLFHPRAL